MAHAQRTRWWVWSLASLSALPAAAVACSSCGCSLNSDWASQGYTTARGWHLSVRQDYFDQSQLYRGTDVVARNSFAYPADEEVQLRTINRNTLLAADDQLTRVWSLTFQLPVMNRYHRSVAEGDTALSTSEATGIGDLRIMARYQGLDPDASVGLQFGLKLPTGRFTQAFLAGPQSGARLDRGLQLGTGTTDALLGAYQFGYLGPSVGYFAQVIAQVALDGRDHFRPGNSANASLGVRYLGWARVTPQLQLDLHSEQRERGAQADRPNSGASFGYVSPGLSVAFTRRLDAFAFVQFPVWVRVNGLQLEPRRLWSLGLSYRW